ncbi:MAG: DUF4159 domain-containing protein [Candidatus Hydrogenedentes bacterium]|nr:DUF4159 domain-containing protein [Candidatus Hydrogenedentota bacterium]
MRIFRVVRVGVLVTAAAALLGAADTAAPSRDDLVQCANLIYAGSKSSRCFSAKFLDEVRDVTRVDADSDFTPVKLSTEGVFNYPFAVMTGEGEFTLFEEERTMLKSYLTRGGFLLASAGCSSREWDRSFRREFKAVFPDKELHKIPMEHPLFKTVFNIEHINLKNGGTTLLEGLELDGRIVLVYSSEGLNDTGNVQGCCCCGGNEVKNSKDVNTNIITYALTH